MKRWQLVSNQYEDFYHEDNPDKWFAHLYKTRKNKVLKIMEEIEGDILDLGGGDGNITHSLISKTRRVFVLDSIFPLLLRAREKGGIAICADIEEDIPLKEQKIDCVLAGEVLEHVFDTDALISRVKKILKPGGYFIVTLPNTCSLLSRIKLFFGNLPVWIDNRGPHIRAYNLKAIVNQLKKHGFKIEETKATFIFIPVARLFINWNMPFGKNLGENIIVKARNEEVI